MNDWVNLSDLWRVIVLGALCGAGLPALFAVGLRILSVADRAGPGPGGAATAATTGATVAVSRNPVNLAAAGLCFAVILAAIGWGIYLIVAGT